MGIGEGTSKQRTMKYQRMEIERVVKQKRGKSLVRKTEVLLRHLPR